MNSANLLLHAITIIGSRQRLIQLLDISPQRLNTWLNGRVVIGYEYAIAIEYLTAGVIKASDLAPQKAKIIKKASAITKQTISHQKIVATVCKCLSEMLCDPSADFEIRKLST